MIEEPLPEISEREYDSLAVLVEGRSNPYLIREETGLDSAEVNTVLVKLSRRGLATRVVRGLYEITEAGEATYEAHEQRFDGDS
jgi:DNA-binding MarR family transcriptional regulator